MRWWSRLRGVQGARAGAQGGVQGGVHGGMRSGSPPWWRVLGFESGPPASLCAAETRFRQLAAAAHPDRGGSVDAMQRLNRARAEARRVLAS